MQTRHLKTLVKISQVGSFANAAAQLDMTLSSVSMQMKALEEDLEVSLFDRSFRPPQLTPKGREVAEKALKVIAAENEIFSVSKNDDVLVGKFNIGFVATASVRMLPHFLKNAQQYAEAARFEVETGLSEVLEKRVLNGQLDAAVVTASDRLQKGLHYHVLCKEQLYFAIPGKFKNNSPRELMAMLPFLHFNPGSGIGKLIAEQIDRLGNDEPKQAIMLDSVEAIMQCVNEGIGFTILAEPDVKRYGKGDVKLENISSKEISRTLVLATSSTQTKNLRFVEKLMGLFDLAE